MPVKQAIMLLPFSVMPAKINAEMASKCGININMGTFLKRKPAKPTKKAITDPTIAIPSIRTVLVTSKPKGSHLKLQIRTRKIGSMTYIIIIKNFLICISFRASKIAIYLLRTYNQITSLFSFRDAFQYQFHFSALISIPHINWVSLESLDGAKSIVKLSLTIIPLNSLTIGRSCPSASPTISKFSMTFVP